METRVGPQGAGSYKTLDNKITDTYDLANAELTDIETGGTITTDGSEQVVWENNAPAGIFEPLIFKIDTTALTAVGPDSVTVRVYERIKSGGNLILAEPVDQAGNATVYTNVQTNPLKAVVLNPNRFGVRVTIERTAGADHAYVWEVIHRS